MSFDMVRWVGIDLYNSDKSSSGIYLKRQEMHKLLGNLPST